jgi:hypothetical protein
MFAPTGMIGSESVVKCIFDNDILTSQQPAFVGPWLSQIGGRFSLNIFSGIKPDNDYFSFNCLLPVSDSADSSKFYNVFIGFAGNNRAFTTTGGADVVSLPNQYWGTSDSSKIVRDAIFDFWKDATRPMLDFRPILISPPDSAHGCVWKVLVDGIDPQIKRT